jgi:hypothetical protein
MLNSRCFPRTKWFDPVSKFIKGKDSPAATVEFNLVDGSTIAVGHIWTEDDHVRLEVYEEGGEMSLRFVPYERIAQVIVRRQPDESGRRAFKLTEQTD